MLAILADDLTGALDAAAPFAGRGLSTMVALEPEGIEAALAYAPAVLTVSLRCRDGSADDALRITQGVFARLPNGCRIFKKIDSRLKGHIATELRAYQFHRALAAPAIPDFGRVTKEGHVTGFGVDRPISVLEKLGGDAGRFVVPDVASQKEMTVALETAEAEGVDLLIGARGLAEALAQAMTGRQQAEGVVLPQGHGLFVIGSRDPITLAQVAELLDTCPVALISAPNGQVEAPTASGSALTLVQATPGIEQVEPLEVSERLANGVVPALTSSPQTLLLSGGATAEAVMKKMGVSCMQLLGEGLPGLGVGKIGDQYVIAKSGGFGQADTLKRIARMILGEAD